MKDKIETVLVIWFFILAAALGATHIADVQHIARAEESEDQFDRFNAVFECMGHDCEPVIIPEEYLGGSDGACVAAGMWLLAVFDRDPRIERVVIANTGWVPSRYRIIDRAWAECLADEDPQQYCETHVPQFSGIWNK